MDLKKAVDRTFIAQALETPGNKKMTFQQ